GGSGCSQGSSGKDRGRGSEGDSPAQSASGARSQRCRIGCPAGTRAGCQPGAEEKGRGEAAQISRPVDPSVERNASVRAGLPWLASQRRSTAMAVTPQQDYGKAPRKQEHPGARDRLVEWLRDAHAAEEQSEQMLSKFAGRIENYPALKEQIHRHIEETRGQ